MTGVSLWFLTTGTGIVPIISILDGLDSDPDFNQTESISFFWGNRIQQDFVWSPNLKKIKGHDNLSMFKNLLKYRHESKKQVCNSFTYFRGQI